MPEIAIGDVVQIDPAHDEVFGSCFLVVTEVKSWGVQGYVKVPGGGDAYYRVAFNKIVLIGIAIWIREDEKENV